MSRMSLIPLAAVAMWMLSSRSDEHQSAQAQSKLRESFVSIDDIGGSVKIMGRLGIPLEELATVRGVWKPNPHFNIRKGVSELIFEVSHVNGAALRQSVWWESEDVSTIFEGRDVHVVRDAVTVWEVQVCETAWLSGIPGEFYDGHVPAMRSVPRGHLLSKLLVHVTGKPSIPPSPVSAKGQ